jgi:hypothetical protein
VTYAIEMGLDAISTKFQGNSFRHPKAGRGVTQTHRQHNDLINLNKSHKAEKWKLSILTRSYTFATAPANYIINS